MTDEFHISLAMAAFCVGAYLFLHIMFGRMPTWWQEAFYLRKLVPLGLLVVADAALRLGAPPSPIPQFFIVIIDPLVLLYATYFAIMTAQRAWMRLLARHNAQDFAGLSFWWPAAIAAGGYYATVGTLDWWMGTSAALGALVAWRTRVVERRNGIGGVRGRRSLPLPTMHGLQQLRAAAARPAPMRQTVFPDASSPPSWLETSPGLVARKREVINVRHYAKEDYFPVDPNNHGINNDIDIDYFIDAATGSHFAPGGAALNPYITSFTDE
ncbi:MAG: hypothetical protein H6981_06565 [Gammaproteobacteria bacterium]|nr:hypothetical protein [Gammaproteobacteria bacterium]MCP5136446.1 hypothetical protein [Gammaproteobacteria bacterium]